MKSNNFKINKFKIIWMKNVLLDQFQLNLNSAVVNSVEIIKKHFANMQ